MVQQLFTANFEAGDRVALALSYDGSLYYGWQSQRKPNVPTVQEALEETLSSIAAAPITVQCAGRTDRGVHASHQLVHFDTPVARNEKAWVMGANTGLPDGISVYWAKPVDKDFHARFSATARRYRYVILNTPSKPALLAKGVTWEKRPLNAELMHQEAQCLLGEQDFTSFRAVACQSNTPMRNVHCVNVSRIKDFVVIDIQANAFLYHMVRNIAGVLMTVGAGWQSKGWTADVLAAKDRASGGVTAKPEGLYLVDVDYPEHFGLPETKPGPFFLPADN
jgi:tRNA pseudouridine38-40 synthase